MRTFAMLPVLSFVLLAAPVAGAAAAGDTAEMPINARLAYLELPASDVPQSKRFYSDAFGFAFTDFGPTYAGTLEGTNNIGLTSENAPPAPLPGIQVDNLEAALESVKAAGGTIDKDIFAFPGGRRFEFSDPYGNKLAVFVAEE